MTAEKSIQSLTKEQRHAVEDLVTSAFYPLRIFLKIVGEDNPPNVTANDIAEVAGVLFNHCSQDAENQIFGE